MKPEEKCGLRFECDARPLLWLLHTYVVRLVKVGRYPRLFAPFLLLINELLSQRHYLLAWPYSSKENSCQAIIHSSSADWTEFFSNLSYIFSGRHMGQRNPEALGRISTDRRKKMDIGELQHPRLWEEFHASRY